MLGLIHPRINSYDRPQSGNLASFDLFASCYGPELLRALSIRKYRRA